MDFGRLPSVDGVSFDLPPLPERSRASLQARERKPAGDPWLRTGAPAWARKDWVGRLYPRGLADKDFLRTYARRVDAIELNASYYRVPSAEVLDAWASEVPDRFRFCPKLHQSLTHRRSLGDGADEARSFGRHFLRLGDKLGPGFLQLPPWLDASALPGLDQLLGALPPEFRVAVELRHPSWFARGELREEVVRVLERWSAGAVITDVAGRRDVCHASISASFVIVRFVGNGLHPTDRPRADAWLDRLSEWRDLGLDEAYFFAHQPDDALAPELLAHVARRARDRGLDVPAIDLDHDPATRAPAAQLGLFGIEAASGPVRAPPKPAKGGPRRRA